jgi:threonine dehydrogenase-like Zn-dependent dehydrogenase
MVGLTPDDVDAYLGPHGGDAGIRPGTVMGSEIVGVVAATGSAVSGVGPGDRVSVTPWSRCGTCPACRTRSGTPCDVGRRLGHDRDGGLADEVRVPAASCHAIPGQVPDDQAVLAHVLSHALRAVRRSGLTVGDDVAVLGADDYGLATLVQARRAGAGSVAVVDPRPGRRDAARLLGAGLVVDPATDDVVKSIREGTAAGADIVFTSLESYVPAGAEYVVQACQALRVAGRVVIVRVQGGQGFDALVHGRLAVPLSKEAHIRFVGPAASGEPVRGGEARGEWRLAIEQFAAGVLDVGGFPLDVRAWSELTAPDAADRLLRAASSDGAKIAIRMGV